MDSQKHHAFTYNVEWRKHNKFKDYYLAKVRANIANILWAKKTAFMRSATTPMKVNRSGWNLEHCEPNVGGWPWRFFGAIPAVATVLKGVEIFCEVNNARFHRFPVKQILRWQNIIMLHQLHIADRFGRILYCVHSTQCNLPVFRMFWNTGPWSIIATY